MPKFCYELFAGCGGAGVGMKQGGYTPCGGIEYHPPAADIYELNHYHPLIRNNILDVDRIPYVDLLWGSPPCFPVGVTVLTTTGLRDISTIQIGDLVLTHKGRYQPVTNVMSRIASTITLEGLGHSGLEVTPNHPFLASQIKKIYPPYKERCKGNYAHSYLSKPEWMPASEMKGQHWLSLDLYPTLPIPELVYNQDESRRGQSFDFGDRNFWWMVGCWVGDGWVRYEDNEKGEKNRGTVFICDGLDKTSEIENALNAAGIKFSKSLERTTVRFSIHSRPLCRWLTSEFGKYAHGKSLPSWLLGATQEIKTAFLEGYFYADGHEFRGSSCFENPIKCNTVSRNLAYSLRMLGLSLGYSVTIKLFKRKREKQVIEGRVVNEKPCYSLSFGKTDRHSKCLEYDDVTYRTGIVRKSQDCQQSTTVWDITVAEDESFIADGIVVHNCPSFSVANQNRGEKDNDIALAQHVAKLMVESRPRHIAIENVRAYGKSKSLAIIYEALVNAGYDITSSIECAANYGAPTTRERFIFRATLGTLGPIVQTHFNPAKQKQQELFGAKPSWNGWWDAIAEFWDDLEPSHLTENQIKAIAHKLPNPKLGPSQVLMANDNGRGGRRYVRTGERPAHTITAASKNDRVLIERVGYYNGNPGTWQPEVPSPTIRSSQHIDDKGSYRVAYNIVDGYDCYKADIRCLASWQGFPADYNWGKNRGEAGRAIGNAVAVQMAMAVAKSFG